MNIFVFVYKFRIFFLLCLLPSKTDHGESVSDAALARGSSGPSGGNRSFSSSSSVGSRVPFGPLVVIALAIISMAISMSSSSLVVSKSLSPETLLGVFVCVVIEEEGLGTYDLGVVTGDMDAMEVLVDVGAGVGRINSLDKDGSG